MPTQTETRKVRRSTQIELPWPPSVNHYWGNKVITPYGRKPFVQTFVTARGVSYRERVKDAVWARWGSINPIPFRLAVVILARMPDRRQRDLDNLPKAVLDSLTAARVWEDDSQIDDLRVIRGPVFSGGKLVVTIEEIPDDQGELF